MSEASFLRVQCRAAFDYIYTYLLRDRDWPQLHCAISAYERRSEAGEMMAYFYTLPILSCMTVGGRVEQAMPLAAAWILYDLASDIFDDLQDQDKPDAPWQQWSADQAMLVGVGALFAAQLGIAFLTVPDRARAEIQRAIADAGLQAARGQSLSVHSYSVSDYFQRTVANTGIVFATMAWAGARIHTEDSKHLSALYDYGLALGMLLQIWDDCMDLSPAAAVSDLARGNYTLPILYALAQTEHPCHGRLASLVHGQGLVTLEARVEVVQLLHEMQAWPFVMAMAKAYEQKALVAVERFSHEQTIFLRGYVERLFQSFIDR
jgi:geranylgeranyl pyrophosphate synthase